MPAEQPVTSPRPALSLPPEPTSVSLARRWLRGELEAARHERHLVVDDEVFDTAALLVSELVTNAVLHARTEISLAVTIDAGLMQVQVADGSARMPVPRHYGASATTGRGTALVQALAEDCGTEVIDGGKSAWFTLLLSAAAPQRAWAPTAVNTEMVASPSRPLDATGGSPASRTVTVTLLGLPVLLYRAWVPQVEGLLREYLLAAFGGEPDEATITAPTRAARGGDAAGALAALTDALTAVVPDTLPAPAAVDVRVDVAVSEAAQVQVQVLRAVLAEANTMAEDETLLAPPSQPEIVALSEWLCDQVATQPAGATPGRWQPPTRAGAPRRAAVVWDTAAVTGTLHAVIAADDANRILAVSPAVTVLLGWTAQELVGQRIITVIPGDLREAHIAGFTRYLATGQSRILDQPVQVPALHRDGHHVPVTLTLRRELAPGSRQIFLAQLAPELP